MTCCYDVLLEVFGCGSGSKKWMNEGLNKWMNSWMNGKLMNEWWNELHLICVKTITTRICRMQNFPNGTQKKCLYCHDFLGQQL